MCLSRLNLWIMILVTALVTALLKSMLLLYYGYLNIFKILENIWTSLISNCGGKPPPSKIDSKWPYKIVIFTTLLAGVIIFIAYRCSITAALAVSMKVYPFKDMDSFSETSWK